MICAIVLFVATAAAGPAAVVDTFEMTVGGVPYATEEFLRTDGPDGVVITGKMSLKAPGVGVGVMKQEARIARDGHPVSYILDVDLPGQQVLLRAVPTASGYAMSVTPKGASEPAQSQDVAAKAPVFLLDNAVASHLDALTRGLVDLGVGGERAFTALVPQVFQALPGSIRRGPDGKAALAGTPVETRTYHLVVANVGMELVARAGDGALLQAEVAMQRAILKRRGFEPATAPAANEPVSFAADPRERAVEVKGSAGALPATLLVPKADAPVPAVVLLSGSGPNDKDETIGPNKPFADVARGLGDRGIASLRFDKRTFAVKDKSKFATVRLEDEYYEDARVALALLSATPGVDPARIFVVGHSEGAMVAPNVAAGFSRTRGIVMMAPGVRPIDAMIIDQTETGARRMGQTAAEIAEQTRIMKETFAAIRDPERSDTPPYMGAPAAYWRELMALDVPKLVLDSKLPILVLQGDQDFQVRKDADFEVLRTRVGDTGGRVTYRSFAGLNHLFMKVDGESTGAEYAFPGHVEPAVIAAIAEWILAR